MKSKRWNLGFFTSRFVTPGKSTVWFCCFSWVEGYIHIISNVWNRFPLSHLYSCVNCTVVYQFHSFTAKGADLAGSSCVHQCLKRTTHFQKVVGKGLPFFFFDIEMQIDPAVVNWTNTCWLWEVLPEPTSNIHTTAQGDVKKHGSTEHALDS